MRGAICAIFMMMFDLTPKCNARIADKFRLARQERRRTLLSGAWRRCFSPRT